MLELIAQGVSHARLAERLSLSLKSVRNRVSNSYRKLHVADRTRSCPGYHPCAMRAWEQIGGRIL